MYKMITGALFVAAGLATLATDTQARAIAIMVLSGPAKIAQADIVIAGQVIGIEDKDVEAKPNPAAPNKVAYRIAVVQVTETLKGDAKQKTVRVGFMPSVGVQPGPGPKILPIKKFNIQLAVGQSGMFFLKKHQDGGFYTLPMFGTFVAAENKENFDRELDVTRKTLKVLANPMAGLKSKEAAERLETAATLITLYRTANFGGPSTQTPIEADESKLILKTLLDADWDQTKYQGIKYQQSPAILFNRLNVGVPIPAGKGFNSPEYTAAAKTWLATNWQTYRIQKFVATSGTASVNGPGTPIQIKPLPPQSK